MNLHIDNIKSMNKLPLIIGIIMPIIIVSITFYVDDLAVSLSILILLSILTAFLIFFILNPFWGLIFIIAYKPLAYVVEIPFIHSGGRQLFIILLLGWFLKYILPRKSVFFELVKANRILLLFVFSMCISSLFAFNPKASFLKIIEIISYIIMSVFIMQDVITNEKQLNILITAIALSIGISSLFAINDYLVLGNVNQYGAIQRIGGIYTNPNALGLMMAFGIPFILFMSLSARSYLIKLLFSVLFLTSFFSLGLAVSRTFLIQFVVFMIAYILLGLKHKIINIKMITILIVIIVPFAFLISHYLIDNIMTRAEEEVSDSLRQVIFLKGLLLLKEHPLVGIGLENYQYTQVSDNSINRRTVGSQGGSMEGHDIVSRVFASIGILGITVLLIIFYRVLKNMTIAAGNRSLKNNRYLFHLLIVLQAGYIGLLCSAIGTSLIYDSQFWIYYSLSVLILRWCKLSDREYRLKESYEVI